jgi:hypothetical protein
LYVSKTPKSDVRVPTADYFVGLLANTYDVYTPTLPAAVPMPYGLNWLSYNYECELLRNFRAPETDGSGAIVRGLAC